MYQKNPRRSYCDHCKREFKTPKPCLKHEAHCFKNPGRTPYLGELTSVTALGKIEDCGFHRGGNLPNGGFQWFEFVYRDEMPKWWPGPGKIWTGEEWQDVPFYESAEITGAHGCAGGAGPEDHWPTADGEPLNKIRPVWRLDYLDSLEPWAPPPAKPQEPFWPEIFEAKPGYWLSPAAREALA